MDVFSVIRTSERPCIIPDLRRVFERAPPRYNSRGFIIINMSSIRLDETTDLATPANARDGLALRFDPTRRINLRFRLSFESSNDVEALRYARRVMIREERTRGLEWEEPSIEDAVFSVNDVSWPVLASQAAWCREKIAELVERALRARDDVAAGDPQPTG
jgi:hypothetical protein